MRIGGIDDPVSEMTALRDRENLRRPSRTPSSLLRFGQHYECAVLDWFDALPADLLTWPTPDRATLTLEPRLPIRRPAA